MRQWQLDSAALIFRAETAPGEAYRAMIEGELILPVLPTRLRYAVFPELAAIEAELDPAIAYAALLEIGR